MTSSLHIAKRGSSTPVRPKSFDVEVDIVVVGSGVGGLSAALFSRWLGNEVLLLEKASELGGTTRKAAFWYWVPNNAAMRALGIEDPKSDCIRYMARLSRPEAYDPADAKFGMSAWEYSAYEAIYDNASLATELLAEKGALEYRHCPDVPDYWAEFPEDKATKGRVLLPKERMRYDVRRRRSRNPDDVRRRPPRRRRHPQPAIGSSASYATRAMRSSASRPAAQAERVWRFGRARRSSSRPADSPTTSKCARTFCRRRCSEVARPSRTKAISSTSGRRSGRNCAT